LCGGGVVSEWEANKRMRVRVLFGVASVAAVVGMLWGSVTPARACSPGPDFDPVAESELIVGGRITGWKLVENVRRWDPKSSQPEPTADPNYWGPASFDPIRLAMSVDRVYKGTSAAEIELFSANTMSISPEGGVNKYVWGSGASCGAFDNDPTGGYFILGLVADQFGRLHPSLLLTFYIGPQPPVGPGDTVVARLEGLGLSAWSLPDGGGPPEPVGGGAAERAAAVALAVLGPLAFLAGAAFLWRRGSQRMGSE